MGKERTVVRGQWEMKKTCKTLLFNILSLLNRMVPKQKKIVMYAGSSLYDNTEAFFSYLIKNTDYKIVCIADKHMDYGAMRQGVIFRKNSFCQPSCIGCGALAHIAIFRYLYLLRLFIVKWTV